MCSSKGQSSTNISQTIKQPPRIYEESISQLLASSPAYENQYRLIHGIGQTVTSTTTMTIVSSSNSPCLLYI
ncbi:unnamed protein product [Rotaria sordida]|uniref:Uncharacterized protein n=1 Tax=Rotaria sordida TaxID=392033 RepID=A0A815ZAF4_9BILA|nr:unnamed protein product [Rotaria sordida]CAF1580992.1 unnamed protein product [Rotaria sordida]